MYDNTSYYPKTRNKGQIVCMSSTHWHFLWQRPQQIMSRLSRDYNILYVDPPFPVSVQEAESKLNQKNYHWRLKTICNSLKVFSPFKLANTESNDHQRFIMANDELVKNQVRHVLSALKWYCPLLWIYDLAAVSLVNKLDEKGVVYDCVDSFASFSWADPHTEKWEEELLVKADLVLTSSKNLYQERVKRHPRTYLVPNAADFQHFCKTGSYFGVEPAEIKQIKRPRLAFVGAVYEWLDFELLKILAENNPSWSIIIVGPKQHNLQVPEAKNLYWLGTRDYKLLPLYIANFDLMLIPFLLNEITKNANPIKLWEYLAAGKAIVSTRLPEVPECKDVIWLSDNAENFQDNCNQVLNLLRDPTKRLEIAQKGQLLAKQNSWDERCRMICALLKHYFKI